MIEKLFDAITEKNRKLVELMEVFGEDYWYVNQLTIEIRGMQNAFEIIAGHTYTDHVLMKMAA